jgi:glycerophosphoryl diester phosphodiesterase
VSAADHPYFAPPPIGLAHRGGSLHPPNVGVENTLRAFTEAVSMGFRYLETDVHATSDGVLVAFHDEDLARVTDRPGLITDLPWRQVKAARIGGREPIPTLDQVLESLPQTRVNIDIKSPGAIEPLWATIRAHAAYERVCVGSFSGQPRRFPSVGRPPGGDRRRPTRHCGDALPARCGDLVAGDAGAGAADPPNHVIAGREVALVTPALLGTAHRLGKQVHVWTIDDADEMTELLELGVDGIVSDRIDVLRDVLTARGAWPQ